MLRWEFVHLFLKGENALVVKITQQKGTIIDMLTKSAGSELSPDHWPMLQEWTYL